MKIKPPLAALLIVLFAMTSSRSSGAEGPDYPFDLFDGLKLVYVDDFDGGLNTNFWEIRQSSIWVVVKDGILTGGQSSKEFQKRSRHGRQGACRLQARDLAETGAGELCLHAADAPRRQGLSSPVAAEPVGGHCHRAEQGKDRVADRRRPARFPGPEHRRHGARPDRFQGGEFRDLPDRPVPVVGRAVARSAVSTPAGGPLRIRQFRGG